ncbi:MAG TPA: hypothetical protein VM032_09280 [Vicinamibacterales bacterium]|nr:hypothetical protein [Vicinamibacterales bacterium]
MMIQGRPHGYGVGGWLRLAVPVVLLPAALSSGCLSRSRLNGGCEWVGDASYRLDLQRAADRQHLVGDVELAEELGIRYGDTFRKDHGRLEEHAQASACQARLVRTIADTHGLTAAIVQAARASRPALADGVTLTLFAVLYGLASLGLIRTARARLADAGLGPLVVGYGVSGLAMSGLGVLGLNLVWVPVVEIIRTGNMHRSLRVAPLPWPSHLLSLFLGGVVAFALILAVSHLRRMPDQPMAHRGQR